MAHEVMLALQTGTVMSDPQRMRYESDQFYLKSGEEMQRLFPDEPEALENTVRIAERCHVDLRLGKELHFPQYVVPGGLPQKDYLASLVNEGLRRRYGLEDPNQPRDDRERVIVDRSRFELGVIEKTGFINYFLVVWDFVRFARERGIPVGPGRGSGAGSIVAYALGITGIDPLRYQLIFERFLNPDRVSPPDFDIDFCQLRRGEVIDYVRDKYGRDSVAQIITFATLGARAVIRDVGRVLEIPLVECDRLARMVPEEPNMTLEKALKNNPDFSQATKTDPNARRIFEFARILEGLPRNAGTHAAGVVISEKPLCEILPLTSDKNGETITQYSMKPIEQVGLLKMDFLGLKTLTIIEHALEWLRQSDAEMPDMENLPLDDELTYQLLNRGDTVAIFQLESSGMRDLVRRIQLSRFEDLIAMIALYRPGPMDMLSDFVNRKQGKVPIRYEHPLLEPILKETYGVMLYQEQVQMAANVLAGFSMSQGDLLRRAMGKKNEREMARMRSQFVEGCAKQHRLPRARAEELFNNIEKFAGYGFNKSHSAGYAVICYQTAWLKAHHPVAFMAANLSVEHGDTERVAKLIAEAQEMGIGILPPDINESGQLFQPVGPSIRFGLAGIKNVGAGAVRAIIAERDTHGPYRGLSDVCTRLDGQTVNRKVLECLVRCGAFDFTGQPRSRLFAGIEAAQAAAAALQRDRRSGQQSLFAALDPDAGSVDGLPAAEPWPESRMLADEKELLGFYITGHPLTAHAWTLKTFNLADASALEQVPGGTMTRLGGLVSDFHKRLSKREKPYATFRLEHLDGSLEVLVFEAVLQEYGVYLKEGAPVMVCGELGHSNLERDDKPRLKAHEIYPLADVPRVFAERVQVHIHTTGLDDERLARVRELLLRHPGETPVTLCLQYPSGERVMVKPHHTFTVSAGEKLLRDVEHLLGKQSLSVDVIRKVCRKPPPTNSNSAWRNKRNR